MMKNVKQKILNTATASFAASMLFFASSAMAVPSTFPTSGTCSMLVSHGSPEGATVPIQIAYSTLATLDFATGTIL